MRESLVRAFCAGMVVGAFIVAAIVFASPSKADPANEVATAVCSALDRTPTVAEVARLVTVLVSYGVTPFEAGQIIAVSVETHCTRNLPVLAEFVDAYAPQGVTI